MKLLTTLMLLLISISFISAIEVYEVYSGESHSIVIQEPYEFYSVVGNSTPVDLTIELDGLNATITFGKYINDSFEIIFFNSEKEIITVYSGGGGGGGGSSTKTIYKDRNITTYVDKEIEVIKEVPGETSIVEKIIGKTSMWTWFFLIALIIVLIFILVRYFFYSEDYNYTDERRYKNNE